MFFQECRSIILRGLKLIIQKLNDIKKSIKKKKKSGDNFPHSRDSYTRALAIPAIKAPPLINSPRSQIESQSAQPSTCLPACQKHQQLRNPVLRIPQLCMRLRVSACRSSPRGPSFSALPTITCHLSSRGPLGLTIIYLLFYYLFSKL